MPTLVRVDIPVNAVGRRGRNESSDDSLDETTLDLNGGNSSHRQAGDSRNKSALLDRSTNLLLDDSSHSLSSSDDSSLSTRSCTDKGKSNCINTCKDKSNGILEDSSHGNSKKTQHQNSPPRMFLNDTTMLSQSPCRTPPRKETAAATNCRERLSASNQEKVLGKREQMLQNNDSHSRILPDDTTRLSLSTCSSPSPTMKKPRQPGTDDHSESRILNDTTNLSNSLCSTSEKIELSDMARKEDSQTIFDGPETMQYPERPKIQLQWSRREECDNFKSKFRTMVTNFEKRYPRIKLLDYNALSTEDQRIHQDNVVSLLDRLNIRKANTDDDGTANASLEECSMKDISITRIDSPTSFLNASNNSHFGYKSETSPVDSLQKKESCPLKDSPRNGPSIGMRIGHRETENDLSISLLSPIAGGSPKHLTLNNDNMVVRFSAETPVVNRESQPTNSNRNHNHTGSTSQASVEITRGAVNSSCSSSLYESPPIMEMVHSKPSKRSASTSGKRGNDAFRTRLSQENSLSDSDNDRMPSPQSWNSSDESTSHLSVDKQPPFSPPQSSPRRTGRSSQRGQQGRFEQKDFPRSSRTSKPSQHAPGCDDNDETIDSVDVTMLRDRGRRSQLREMPANIALKDGVPFHYNPLHVKKTKRTSRRERTTGDQPCRRAFDLPDPLGVYVGAEGEELCHIFEWMEERDQAHSRGEMCSSDSKGIIFSLDQGQIVNVAIKLLLEAEARSNTMARERFVNDAALSGQTLIIVRDKEHIEYWERALREHTPFSVINHAGLPCRDRKRSAAAAKCATFDVVISTFDAAKAPDVTTQVDDNGHAVLRQHMDSQADGGWLTKRSASGASQSLSPAVKTKQLSVLHRINWRRIIFVDELGRKCFLAKLGTSRAYSARALNSDTR
jgi:hypothetical protein